VELPILERRQMTYEEFSRIYEEFSRIITPAIKHLKIRDKKPPLPWREGVRGRGITY
jgi:hypothetical protein